MHFPYGIRTRQEGTMMPTALRLVFLLRPVSGVDTYQTHPAPRRFARCLE
jgi:hypothetical protein